MILVDSSVWIDHLREGDPDLIAALDASNVLMHPFVLGELALGNLRQRAIILESLSELHAITPATDSEVRAFIDRQNLAGRGIGYIDAHLLASCRLTHAARLWTRDKRLRAVAQSLDIAINELH